MNLNISGHHLDLTDSLREYVIAKLQRVERHFDHLIDANVVLSVEKNEHRAEGTLHASGANLHAESVQEDMYSAIDTLIDKLDRQTVKHKERRKDHHAKEVRRSAAEL